MFFFRGSTSVMMSSWGNGMIVNMVLASKLHHGSYDPHEA